MTKLSETKHAGCFLISNGPGHISFEEKVVAASQTLNVGHVIALNASDEVIEMDPDGSAPANAAVGILFDAVTTGTATGRGVIVARDAEVRESDLSWISGISAAQKTTALTALSAFHIVARS